jgi:hypothetical protein
MQPYCFGVFVFKGTQYPCITLKGAQPALSLSKGHFVTVFIGLKKLMAAYCIFFVSWADPVAVYQAAPLKSKIQRSGAAW